MIANSQSLLVPSLHSFSRGQNKKSRTNARGRCRVQFFESEAEDKILASRPACPRGLNITGINTGVVFLLANSVEIIHL